MIHIFKIPECEKCKGTGMLVWQAPNSPMNGLTKPCDRCSFDYKAFINNYGKDENDSHPVNEYKLNENGLMTIKKVIIK